MHKDHGHSTRNAESTKSTQQERSQAAKAALQGANKGMHDISGHILVEEELAKLDTQEQSSPKVNQGANPASSTDNPPGGSKRKTKGKGKTKRNAKDTISQELKEQLEWIECTLLSEVEAAKEASRSDQKPVIDVSEGLEKLDAAVNILTEEDLGIEEPNSGGRPRTAAPKATSRNFPKRKAVSFGQINETNLTREVWERFQHQKESCLRAIQALRKAKDRKMHKSCLNLVSQNLENLRETFSEHQKQACIKKLGTSKQPALEVQNLIGMLPKHTALAPLASLTVGGSKKSKKALKRAIIHSENAKLNQSIKVLPGIATTSKNDQQTLVKISQEGANIDEAIKTLMNSALLSKDGPVAAVEKALFPIFDALETGKNDRGGNATPKEQERHLETFMKIVEFTINTDKEELQFGKIFANPYALALIIFYVGGYHAGNGVGPAEENKKRVDALDRLFLLIKPENLQVAGSAESPCWEALNISLAYHHQSPEVFKTILHHLAPSARIEDFAPVHMCGATGHLQDKITATLSENARKKIGILFKAFERTHRESRPTSQTADRLGLSEEKFRTTLASLKKSPAIFFEMAKHGTAEDILHNNVVNDVFFSPLENEIAHAQDYYQQLLQQKKDGTSQNHPDLLEQQIANTKAGLAHLQKNYSQHQKVCLEGLRELYKRPGFSLNVIVESNLLGVTTYVSPLTKIFYNCDPWVVEEVVKHEPNLQQPKSHEKRARFERRVGTPLLHLAERVSVLNIGTPTAEELKIWHEIFSTALKKVGYTELTREIELEDRYKLYDTLVEGVKFEDSNSFHTSLLHEAAVTSNPTLLHMVEVAPVALLTTPGSKSLLTYLARIYNHQENWASPDVKYWDTTLAKPIKAIQARQAIIKTLVTKLMKGQDSGSVHPDVQEAFLIACNCKEQSHSMVPTMLKELPKITSENFSGENPLIYIVRSGNQDAIKYALSPEGLKKLDINGRDSAGDSPLLASANSPEVLDMLINTGKLKPGQKDPLEKNSILHDFAKTCFLGNESIMNNRWEWMRKLHLTFNEEFKSQVNAKNTEGLTPLDLIVENLTGYNDKSPNFTEHEEQYNELVLKLSNASVFREYKELAGVAPSGDVFQLQSSNQPPVPFKNAKVVESLILHGGGFSRNIGKGIMALLAIPQFLLGAPGENILRHAIRNSVADPDIIGEFSSYNQSQQVLKALRTAYYHNFMVAQLATGLLPTQLSSQIEPQAPSNSSKFYKTLSLDTLIDTIIYIGDLAERPASLHEELCTSHELSSLKKMAAKVSRFLRCTGSVPVKPFAEPVRALPTSKVGQASTPKSKKLNEQQNQEKVQSPNNKPSRPLPSIPTTGGSNKMPPGKVSPMGGVSESAPSAPNQIPKPSMPSVDHAITHNSQNMLDIAKSPVLSRGKFTPEPVRTSKAIMSKQSNHPQTVIVPQPGQHEYDDYSEHEEDRNTPPLVPRSKQSKGQKAGNLDNHTSHETFGVKVGHSGQVNNDDLEMVDLDDEYDNKSLDSYLGDSGIEEAVFAENLTQEEYKLLESAIDDEGMVYHHRRTTQKEFRFLESDISDQDSNCPSSAPSRNSAPTPRRSTEGSGLSLDYSTTTPDYPDSPTPPINTSSKFKKTKSGVTKINVMQISPSEASKPKIRQDTLRLDSTSEAETKSKRKQKENDKGPKQGGVPTYTTHA